MIEVYKIMNEIYDKNVTTFLKTRVQSVDRTRSRGHKYQLYIERVNKNIRKQNFSIRIINIWNSLPREVAEAPSINSFKNRLDKFWSDQDIVFNYKAKLNINRKSADGRIYEDLETVAAK
jgi:hypothetical protein